MDLNDYWQENKRFVSTVAAGAVVFLIAYLVVGGRYEGQIGAQRGERVRLQGKLRDAHYTQADYGEAEDENDALVRAVDRLSAAVAFRPREAFHVDRSAGAPSAGSQYLRAMNDVSAALIPRAKRANMQVDEGLGMPALSPTREDDIERYLEALDVIDTTLNLAIDCGVQRVDDVAVRLDPGLSTRQGVGRVERTEVRFRFEGAAAPLTELLARLQRPPDGRPLTVQELEMVASRFKPGDASLELKLAAVRLHPPTPEEEDL
jgi:hypothetical protein